MARGLDRLLEQRQRFGHEVVLEVKLAEADQTAKMSQLGRNDVLLAIATRAFGAVIVLPLTATAWRRPASWVSSATSCPPAISFS